MRPTWHRLAGAILVAAGVAIVVVNDAMLLGGVPTWLLPGGHREAYLFIGLAVAASGTWWFGWFDRSR